MKQTAVEWLESQLRKKHTLTTDDIKIIGEAKEIEEKKLNYWKKRCELAEKCLDETPCDPDITVSQMVAHSEYNGFLSTSNPE